jgi:hypothetical protein
MDEIHVTSKKLNMDKIEPTSETSCNKGKIYYTKTTILKMINITHKQKHFKEESTNQTFNALNVAMDQMHIH